MRYWITVLWNWFWNYRHGEIKYRVLNYGNTYKASASNGNITVWNCYGSTPEKAKEMAKFKFKQALNKK